MKQFYMEGNVSKADKIFIDMCNDILENGFLSQGQTVRARWEDGCEAHTIKKFGQINRYDLSEEFPALTIRPRSEEHTSELQSRL